MILKEFVTVLILKIQRRTSSTKGLDPFWFRSYWGWTDMYTYFFLLQDLKIFGDFFLYFLGCVWFFFAFLLCLCHCPYSVWGGGILVCWWWWSFSFYSFLQFFYFRLISFLFGVGAFPPHILRGEVVSRIRKQESFYFDTKFLENS